MAEADPLGICSDPKNVSLDVGIDEMLSIRKPFPKDELHNHDFKTYDEVHKLLIDNPQFTDQNMLELNNDWDGTCDSPHAARCRHLHAVLR